MKNSETMRIFLNDYKQYVEYILQPTRKEVKYAFSKLREPSYWGKYSKRTRLPDPSPIQRIKVRIKRPESVVDKILRKPGSFPKGLTSESFKRMRDALGIRIIVYFLTNLPLIDFELRNNELIEISEDEPPIAYLSEDLTKQLSLPNIVRRDKESGYNSIHYILRLRESNVPIDHRPWFELQLRTLTEDTWGEIEHILGYKPDKRTSFAVRKQFQIISKELRAIDEHFNFLYEELYRFQEEVTYKDSDPLNAENLPPVLNEIGLGCAQREIDGLLKLLNSRGKHQVGSLLKIATPKNLEFIKSTYRSNEGRPPNNFEVVANLANLEGNEKDSEVLEKVQAQIAFLNAWEELKQILIDNINEPQ
jgi:putative GTP pyrophosphokinase